MTTRHDRQRHREPARHEVLVDLQELVHRLVRNRRAVGDVGDQVHRQEQPDDLLDGAEDHPARAGQEHRTSTNCARSPGVLRRHEAQVVDLLGDLGDQRQAHARGQQHRAEVRRAVALLALVGEEVATESGWLITR